MKLGLTFHRLMENGGERLEEAAASRLSLEEGASLTEGRRPMLREGRGCPSLCPVEAGLVRSRSAVALGSAGLAPPPPPGSPPPATSPPGPTASTSAQLPSAPADLAAHRPPGDPTAGGGTARLSVVVLAEVTWP
uniref:Uncharacterized protein n=1 Tax=Setaria viridis TaxID=4556 RepID=A0A4V6DCV2_SETVI|nr:hypothetical protein SEVIR_1G162300v2 [Setaria viridis]